MIYTSYFAKLNKLPKDCIPISICGKAPDWYTGLQYKKLAPKYKFFMEWKQNHDNDFYIKHFNEEVLDKLDVYGVLKDICLLISNDIEYISDMINCLAWNTNKINVCLLCYEKPSDFCHRHLVAKWLNDNGVKCEELDV